MKTRTENISVNKQDHMIEFEFTNPFDPIEILSVNAVKSVNLDSDFIIECESACAQFLKDEAFAKKEAIEEEHSDESRGN